MKKTNTRKKITIICIIILGIIMVLGISRIFGHGTWDNEMVYYMEEQYTEDYYKEDYPEKYKKQLEIIFGPTVQISDKQTVEVESEKCGCGLECDGYVYDEWIITYKGIDGTIYTQTMNNKTSLSEQQLEWLENHLSQYIKQKYLIDSFEEGTFEDLSKEEWGRTHCSIELANHVSSYSGDLKKEFDRIQMIEDDYNNKLLKELKKDEQMISLYQLSFEEFFERFPLVISLHLSLDDGELTGEEKELYEKEFRKKLLAIMDEINRDSNDWCNLYVQVCSIHGYNDLYDARDWRYYFIQGEQIEVEDHEDYDYEVFYSYEGILW